MDKVIISDDYSFNEAKDYLRENSEPEYIFEFDKKYENHLNLAVYANPVIYGKDQTERIVACEINPENDKEFQVIFHDNTIKTYVNFYYILSSTPIAKNYSKLDGKQDLKYINYYPDEATRNKTYGMNFRKKYLKLKVFWDQREAMMIHYGITLFKGLKVSDISVMSFDIESDGIVQSSESKIFVITSTYENDTHKEVKQFILNEQEDMKLLIDSWCNYVREKDPTILTGHHIFGYDWQYIKHCAKLAGTSLKLGKNGEDIVFAKKTSKKRVDGNQDWEYYNCEVYGRHIIDGMFLAVMYDIGRNYPSWGLKAIAEYEGFVAKDRQFYDASLIGKNWYIPEERQKIIKYCADDGNDSMSIYKLMIPSFFYMTQSISKPFQTIINSASGSWINNILIRAYLQDGRSIPTPNQAEYVAGGMSYGIPGIYTNVSKWDAASYYPSTIRTYKIYDKEKDPEGYYLQLADVFTEERFKNKRLYKETKDKHYDDLQASQKIFINSLYGVLGTPGLNFNSFKNAQLITKLCRKGLQKTVIWATGKPAEYWWSDYQDKKTSEQDFSTFKEVDSKSALTVENMPRHDWLLVNLDTDSLSFCKKDGSAFTDKEQELIRKEINQIMYSEWEFDGMFSNFVVIKAKNYAMIENGKKKIKGASLRDTKREKALIEMLGKCIDLLLVNNKEGCYALFEQYAEEISDVKDISRWAVKKSITETLLSSERLNETKVLDALEDVDFQVGDKIFLYNTVDGEVQDSAKGELIFTRINKAIYEAMGITKQPKLATCEHSDRATCRGCNPSIYKPKMVPNKILKRIEEFDGNYNVEHYMNRLYSTIQILETVLDMSKVPRYDKYQEVVDE